eukprot:CAMPEP_0114388552 /NCGR_PEP_ID=MMETSP0102-20121206/8036_1 /TAXON_ID=38822 ORGANISM="Pteridomonas danica, Strain PT" /NCGR_SAMPLE_ID=MMETSP0102 /ASSEMBLY_ACC=CAM_ASM_000212 /LENGTH=106 /DNA_ID=CAMNT_0001546093 /DNA_START=187 /DNA_END=504 /DNA_ORIENTATION=+
MNTSGSATMKESLKQSFKTFFRTPHKFLGNKAYLAVAAVYAGTYISANFTQTYLTHKERDPTGPKLVATTLTNSSMSVTKDSMFAVWFGATGAAKGGIMSVPIASW